MNGPAIRLLVKTTATGTSAELTMADGGGTAQFTIDPIGRIASPAPASASGAAAGMIGAWQIWTLQSPLTEPTLWDLCHRLVEGKVSFDGGMAVYAVSVIEFAEPVFQQSWGAGVNRTLALAAAGAGAGTQWAPEDPTYPTEVDPYWFRDAQHAQFDNIPGVQGAAGATVRVAHLDTGYDPNHLSLPAHMNYALERNFVDPGQTQGRAVDNSTGFFNNLPPEQWARQWSPSMLPTSAPAMLPNKVEASLCAFHPAGQRVSVSAFGDQDLRGVLPRIAVPTLLLYGDQDARSPVSVGEDLHAMIPGSRLVVMPGVGHVSNIEAPERFNAAVRAFLRSMDA